MLVDMDKKSTYKFRITFAKYMLQNIMKNVYGRTTQGVKQFYMN